MERSVEHIAGIYIFVMVGILVGGLNFVLCFVPYLMQCSLLPFCHRYRLKTKENCEPPPLIEVGDSCLIRQTEEQQTKVWDWC